MSPVGEGRPSLLSERLASRIRAGGPLRFDAFQETALYEPALGYYERAGRIGREGDFVTGSSWHPAFARSLARVARRVRDELGPITVADVGAGEGRLLSWMSEAMAGEAGIAFAGVERSARRRAIAERAAPALLYPSVEALPRMRGLVVAYELFDALPVRSLRVDDRGTIVERCVDIGVGGALAFAELPCADGDAIRRALAARGATLAPGQLFEVRPGAAGLAGALAQKLDAGVLLVFDYGAPARALHGPSRPFGTLEAFTHQRVTRDVLSEPGERDITAWVDFTELEEVFSRAGLAVRGLVSQSRLLLASGIASELAPEDPEILPDAARSAERNAVAKLFAPGGMGEAIRVLVAERETSVGASLARFPAGE